MINIITYPPGIFSPEKAKDWLRRLLRRQRGPGAVLRSLRGGLQEIGVPFQVNPSAASIGADDVVHVLSGARALRYAAALKRSGRIRKLVAGPNVAVSPHDFGGVLLAPEIDVVLQPSRWTRDVYVKLAPALEGKVQIWAAGVAAPAPSSGQGADARQTVLIFQKNGPEELLRAVEELLQKKRLPYRTLRYGHFNQRRYFECLAETKFMVYLSQSESQGLAIHEAWARGVPTLVWDRGYYESAAGRRFNARLVSAPYLTEEAGLAFTGLSDAAVSLEMFLKRLDAGAFVPAQYNERYFSDRQAAKAYLRAIGEAG